MVLQSINSGKAPDPNALKQLQAYTSSAADEPSLRSPQTANSLLSNASSVGQPTPLLGGNYSSLFPSPTSSNSPHLTDVSTPAQRSSVLSNGAEKRDSISVRRSTLGEGNYTSPSVTLATGFDAVTASPAGTALSLLADASLAGELDGRKGITPLDAHFRLSSITEALPFGETVQSPEHFEQSLEAPALLTKHIVDPNTVVELFRLFYDSCYMHLPLIDPTYNTATAVCARSPFLFTVICAVGSRFHSDPELQSKCYEEAHQCFVGIVASGTQRNIESVQACLILTAWAHAPKQSEDRPRLAWLYFGMAVRMGLELGLFRPPAFLDKLPLANGQVQRIGNANPWAGLKDVPEEEQREALNRERTWLLTFVIDR